MRALSTIANEITENWPRPYFGAVPYLQAMMGLDNMSDRYGYDDGHSIVMYFLANATSWRGGVARRVKAELKRMLAAR